MTPIQASKKSNEKVLYNNFKDNRETQKPKFNLAQIVRTADIKRVFSKEESESFNYNPYTITQIIHNTIPSYMLNYKSERLNKTFINAYKTTS